MTRRVEAGNEAKWGALVMERGFCAVPNLLLAHQSELDITPTEMCVLLQILRYWWFADRRPFPTVSTLERALPVKKRAIQRALKGLQEKGLLARDPATRAKSPEYDFSGLREKLEELAGRRGLVPVVAAI